MKVSVLIVVLLAVSALASAADKTHQPPKMPDRAKVYPIWPAESGEVPKDPPPEKVMVGPKGTGTITLTGTSDQDVNLGGLTIENIDVAKSAGTLGAVSDVEHDRTIKVFHCWYRGHVIDQPVIAEKCASFA